MMGWLIRRLHGEPEPRASSVADEVLKEKVRQRADLLEKRIRDKMFDAHESVLRRDTRRGRRQTDV